MTSHDQVMTEYDQKMIRNNKVEKLRAEGSSVARFKFLLRNLCSANAFQAKFLMQTSVKDFLALERALSFIMLSIQISILPSTTFLSFCFCLSF